MSPVVTQTEIVIVSRSKGEPLHLNNILPLHYHKSFEVTRGGWFINSFFADNSIDTVHHGSWSKLQVTLLGNFTINSRTGECKPDLWHILTKRSESNLCRMDVYCLLRKSQGFHKDNLNQGIFVVLEAKIVTHYNRSKLRGYYFRTTMPTLCF